MKKIAILTDSSSGITPEEAKKYEISIIPLHIIIDENTDILDTPENIQKYNVYQVLQQQAVKTSQASQHELQQRYSELLKEYEVIIHYPIAEKLSSQYQSAVNLVNSGNYNNRIYVVKNHTAAFALKSLAIYAHSLVEQNLTPEEIIKKTTQFESEVFMAMIPGSIDQLSKGGRVKKMLVSIINMLKIKILLEWGANPVKNSSSRTVGKLINNAIDLFNQKIQKYNVSYKLFILKNSLCKSSVWTIIENELKEKNINFEVCHLADIFTVHAGIDTIGIVGYPITYTFDKE